MWKKFRSERLKLFENALDERRIDKGIIALAKKINKNKNLVATSTCFGRIVFLGWDITEKNSEVYRQWHKPVDLEEVELAAASYTGKLPLWFTVEPFVLQVSAKDLKTAEKFLAKTAKAGVKNIGIIGSSKEMALIEARGTNSMSVPLDTVDCRWNELVELANRMMETNSEQIKKLEKMEW